MSSSPDLFDPANPTLPGSLFAGKYRVEKVLGQGGMGMVLAARHLGLDEPVAIKLLLPAMLQVPGMVERFTREARASAKIKNDHVVRVTDVDALPSGVPYMVMEHLEPARASRQVERRPPAPARATPRYPAFKARSCSPPWPPGSPPAATAAPRSACSSRRETHRPPGW